MNSNKFYKDFPWKYLLNDGSLCLVYNEGLLGLISLR